MNTRILRLVLTGALASATAVLSTQARAATPVQPPTVDYSGSYFLDVYGGLPPRSSKQIEAKPPAKGTPMAMLTLGTDGRFISCEWFLKDETCVESASGAACAKDISWAQGAYVVALEHGKEILKLYLGAFGGGGDTPIDDDNLYKTYAIERIASGGVRVVLESDADTGAIIGGASMLNTTQKSALCFDASDCSNAHLEYAAQWTCSASGIKPGFCANSALHPLADDESGD